LRGHASFYQTSRASKKRNQEKGDRGWFEGLGGQIVVVREKMVKRSPTDKGGRKVMEVRSPEEKGNPNLFHKS